MTLHVRRVAPPCCAVLLVTAPLGARADRLDDYVRARMRWERIPGLSLAVVKDGKLVRAKGYGTANVETNSPATPRTVYRIGSVSKQFVAAGILLLVQDGKLALDDPIGKFLDGVPAAWKGITVRRLLTHTSGLVRDPPGWDPFKVQPDEEMIRSAFPLPLAFTPGERWAYSNTGYYVLAEIIRRVSGRPWSAFLAERLFAPAGMAATRTITTTGIVPERASGYARTATGVENAENWLAVRPSGAFLSTVLDFVRWDAALSTGTILTSASRTQMWTPVSLNDGTTHPYGFGWFLDPFQGRRRVHHGGGVPGFTADIERFVDDRLTVVVLANLGGADVERIARDVAGFYVPALAPPAAKPIPDTEPVVTARVRSLIHGFLAGAPDLTGFAPETASRLTRTVTARVADELRSPGPIRAFALVERRTDGDARTYRYRLTYPHLTLYVVCAFDRAGKIVGFGTQD
jgi:CubicO group peptidase (beta-lactamase class C family)